MSAKARIVALGGGHGLYATLSALRGITPHLTAIVTVADDGGSSGRLRSEMGIVPPGDLRMALSALCADSEWGHTWRDVLQWRFSTNGELNGHALGNLLIAALWERTGNVVDGLDWVGKLLQAQGRVLPLSTEPLEVSALVRGDEGVKEIVGQAAVAVADGVIEQVRVSPAAPVVPEETIAAIDEADLVVLGPGSWYTSVLTHFLVEPVAQALTRAADRTVVVLNLGYDDLETAGTGRAEDVLALQRLAPDFKPANVLVDVAHANDPGLADAVAEWGAKLVVAPVRASTLRTVHDTPQLRAQFLRLAGVDGLLVTDPSEGVAR